MFTRFVPVLGGSGPQAGDVKLLAWALKRNGCKNDALLLAGAASPWALHLRGWCDTYSRCEGYAFNVLTCI